MDAKVRLGVSRCLLGERVRYDGGHKLDRDLLATLAPVAVFVPVCPEVECGLPVPREAMNLCGDPAAPRLIATATGLDLTEKLTAWAARRLDELASENLCGFGFKTGSPSCGLTCIKVYRDNGGFAETGMGIFARLFRERFALLPCQDELGLRAAAPRQDFIERALAFQHASIERPKGLRPEALPNE
ncbi:MAG: DUF523 domain-containing protein [Desulfovibrionaceae bacterium]|nr:DUF523 domain-containing protein [Desulfovibrionaceae bacterium]